MKKNSGIYLCLNAGGTVFVPNLSKTAGVDTQLNSLHRWGIADWCFRFDGQVNGVKADFSPFLRSGVTGGEIPHN